MDNEKDQRRYWRTNKKIIITLLAVWFVIPYVLGIFFVEELNRLGSLGGFPLGFWIAQQGSIYVFIILIAIYCLWIGAEDRKRLQRQTYSILEDSSRRSSSSYSPMHRAHAFGPHLPSLHGNRRRARSPQ